MRATTWKPWTTGEVRRVVAMASDGVRQSEIALAVARTVPAIRAVVRDQRRKGVPVGDGRRNNGKWRKT